MRPLQYIDLVDVDAQYIENSVQCINILNTIGNHNNIERVLWTQEHYADRGLVIGAFSYITEIIWPKYRRGQVYEQSITRKEFLSCRLTELVVT